MVFAAAQMLAAPADGFDPHPLAGDLVLPMPGGARMVFRPVFLGIAGDSLSTREFQMGDGSGANFREKPTLVHLGGSFVAEKAGTPEWLFYLGKYEVTRAQFDALCPSAGATASQSPRLPKTNVTRREAEEFIERFNKWLHDNSPQSLPKHDGTPGFVRLPSEEEWEFAARGGVAVKAAQFEKPTPFSADVTRYEWFAGARSSHGKLKEIGLLEPHPLGLFDILGNAAEMTSSPYQLTVGAGRTGGFTVRGGSFRSPGEELRVSLRTEQPLVGRDGLAPRDETIGFRLAIASQVFTDTNSREVEQSARGVAPTSQSPAQSAAPMRPGEIPAIQANEPSNIERQLRTLQEEVIKLKSAKVETEKSKVQAKMPEQKERDMIANAPAGATKEKPYINSIGMKFVPVRITGGGPTNGNTVLFSIFETRIQDYKASVPKHPQQGQPDEPVTGVSYLDAIRFCSWLSVKEGKKYRLPTDHEWSCAVGLSENASDSIQAKKMRGRDVFPWDGGFPTKQMVGNYGDIQGYADGFKQVANVGKFPANSLGIYDLGGNVKELCDTRYHEIDINHSEQMMTMRGGSWRTVKSSDPEFPYETLSSSRRDSILPDQTYDDVGFRCVLDP